MTALLRSLGFLLLLCVVTTFPQSPTDAAAKKPKAIKSAELGPVGACDFRLGIRRFMAELSNNPKYQGYIINYSSVSSPSAAEEVARRERLITNSINFRYYDRARITLVRGGARREAATELWLIPPGADYPAVDGIDDRTSSVAEAELYKERSLNVPDEFVLESIKEREKAEEMRRKEELARDTSSDPETDEDDDEASSDDESEPEEERHDPTPTPENWKDTRRFRWADVGLAIRLANTKGTIGVIIFYADDERYDIGKLTKFVEQARDFLAKDAKIDGSRLRVEFGGYRDSELAEFWFVGPDESLPKPRPDERCKEPDDPAT